MSEHPEIVKVKLYQDNVGEWRFSSIASNGNVIVVSSEGYKNRGDAEGAIKGVHGDDIEIETLEDFLESSGDV